MRIAYHYPFLDNIYGNRTIYFGYKHAFLKLNHQFSTFTAGDNLSKFLAENQPDIFITSSHFFFRKFLDYKLLKKYRDKGMFLLTKIDFWNSPIENRPNEARGLKHDINALKLIKDGLLGDAYYHVVEQGDKRMDGFAKNTGCQYYTIPLAADSVILNGLYDESFSADIDYIGTNLPDKKKFFQQYIFPLAKKYNLKIYGQDWSRRERTLVNIQRLGQYFNIPYLKSIQKPKLALADEAKIYRSSTISINIHESYQRTYGGDCNERTFKIPFCGGFEIVDDVACIRKYFQDGKSLIMARNGDDFVDKISYYLKYPQKRQQIIREGKKIASAHHTYLNRVDQIIDIHSEYKQ